MSLSGLMRLIADSVALHKTTYVHTVSLAMGIPDEQVDHALQELVRQNVIVRHHMGYRRRDVARNCKNMLPRRKKRKMQIAKRSKPSAKRFAPVLKM